MTQLGKERKAELFQKGSSLSRYEIGGLLISIIKRFEGKWGRKIFPFLTPQTDVNLP